MTAYEFCHVQIRTRDLQHAKRFYSQVFDWRFQPTTPGVMAIDTGAFPGGELIQTPVADQPLGICHHLRVRDCANLARRARELGGQILYPDPDDPELNWFADTLDPWGNEVAFWQPPVAEAPRHYAGSGQHTFCWVEMTTSNLRAAVTYYSQLFGWTFERHPDTFHYAHAHPWGRHFGLGILSGELARQLNGATTYIRVRDLDQTLFRIERAGGRCLFGPQYTPGQGTFAFFTDPEGHRLAVFEPVHH